MYIDLKFVTLITQQYCSIIILYVKLYEAIGSFPCFPFNNKMKNKKITQTCVGTIHEMHGSFRN